MTRCDTICDAEPTDSACERSTVDHRRLREELLCWDAEDCWRFGAWDLGVREGKEDGMGVGGSDLRLRMS